MMFCFKASPSRYCTILLAVICSISCNQAEKVVYALPEFEKVRTAEFEIIGDSCEELRGVIDDICVYGNYIAVACYNRINGTYLHIFDKHNGRRIISAIHRGRGPNEILWSHNCCSDTETGLIRFFDTQQSKCVYCSIDSLLLMGASVVKNTSYNIPADASYIVPRTLEDEIILCNPKYINADTVSISSRIILRNKHGQVLAIDNTYPNIEDPAIMDICNREARVAISPNGRNLAISLAYASILELYSLSDNSIKNNIINYYIKPDFNTNGGFYPSYTNNTYQGITDIYPTNERLYTSYDGEVNLKKNSELPVSKRELLSRNIAIFGWDGKAIEKIVTDYGIMRLCISEENGETYIYALMHDTERNPYLGKLKL